MRSAREGRAEAGRAHRGRRPTLGELEVDRRVHEAPVVHDHRPPGNASRGSDSRRAVPARTLGHRSDVEPPEALGQEVRLGVFPAPAIPEKAIRMRRGRTRRRSARRAPLTRMGR